jgi:putative addiction module killer protein
VLLLHSLDIQRMQEVEKTMATHPYEMILYLSQEGKYPFKLWLDSLRDTQARARIRKRLDRVEMGNLGDYKSVGAGVMELRIDYGQGYRIYFAQAGTTIILLLCGGDKSTQSQDIIRAKHYWLDFQRRENADP